MGYGVDRTLFWWGTFKSDRGDALGGHLGKFGKTLAKKDFLVRQQRRPWKKESCVKRVGLLLTLNVNYPSDPVITGGFTLETGVKRAGAL